MTQQTTTARPMAQPRRVKNGWLAITGLWLLRVAAGFTINSVVAELLILGRNRRTRAATR